ncbi:MAG: Ig-like domain-containing protein [Lachnospiraceae bacterium]|nr:Ig-like domain-containing protein [Lachnospiraceae bacterium]
MSNKMKMYRTRLFSFFLTIVLVVGQGKLFVLAGDEEQTFFDVTDEGHDGADSYEYALFPMEYLNVTNGESGHDGRKIIDIAGKDSGIDDFYAPFSGTVIRTGVGNPCSIIIESADKVHFADGSLDYVTLWLAHDNDISDLYQGKTFRQGDVIYQEGTNGIAYGNHVHMVSAKGRYAGLTTDERSLNNQKSAYEIFFLPDSMKNNGKIKNAGGYTWKFISGGGFSGGNTSPSYSITNTGVTDINPTSARINATVSPMAYVSALGFYLGTSPDNMIKHEDTSFTGGNVISIWYDLGTGKWTAPLTPNTRYYYKNYIIVGEKTYETSVDSFVTPPGVIDFDPAYPIEEGKIYLIRSVLSNKVIEVTRGVSDNRKQLNVWEYTNDPWQTWTIVKNGDGYLFKNTSTGKAMDVMKGSTSEGAEITQFDIDSSESQVWYLRNAGDGRYGIINGKSGYAVDIYGSYTDNGATLNQYAFHGGDNQLWYFDELSDNSSIITDTGYTDLGRTSVRINAMLPTVRYCSEDGFYLGTSPDDMQKHIETANCRIKTVWFDLGTGKWTSELEKGTTYYYQLYIIVDGVEYRTDLNNFTTMGDKFAPNIGQAYVTNITSNGYTVVCEATDNVGIERVVFPTWTEANGQDDIDQAWFENSKATSSNGNTYYYNVDISAHNNEKGMYITHIYAYDVDGNSTIAPIVVIVPEYVSNLVLSNTSLTLSVGETATINATVNPSTATVKDLMWFSSNESVATVDNGKITAVGGGTTVITVQALDQSGVTATCNVTVNDVPVSSISLSKTLLTLNIGESETLSATVNPSTASVKDVIWSSSNETVAMVSGGIVKAVGAGSAIIKAQAMDSSGVSATCSVTVTGGSGPIIPPDGVVVAEQDPLCPAPVITEETNTMYLIKGQKFTMPEMGWISSDKSIVSISRKGVLKAKKTTSGPIRISKNGRVIYVYVSDPYIISKMTIGMNDSRTVGMSIDREHLNVLWHGSDPNILTVNEEAGFVRGVSAGTAKVIAYINGKKLTCNVKVVEETPAVVRQKYLTVGTTKTLKVKGLKNPVWESSDTSIISVDKNKVSAVSVGHAYLTTNYQGQEYTVEYFVEDPVLSAEGLQRVRLTNKYNITMNAGDERELKFNSITQSVIFKSSKPEVAYVTSDGIVVARKPGKTTLTAKVNGKTISIKVTVS